MAILFSLQVYVPIPDAAARHAILVACLRKASVSPKVDLDAIVTETDAFSGADLAGLCQSAAKISVRRRKEADLREEDTSDWSIMAPDFEIAFRGARSSVPQGTCNGAVW
jgi:SpoVK/Ycf46/Vps4 family AAA+-type ATPase